jgi:ABC-type transport system involved in multi-copper enzyme maturation permease subunit
MNPVLRRELVGLLRTPKATAVQVALAVGCSLLVLVRWPTGAVADLSGARALQVLQVFGYGLLAGVVFLVPGFPAVSIVRERVKGTLSLLLNSPMSPTRIYLGKLGGVLGFTAVLLLATAPAAAACYALGGAAATGGVGLLYAALVLATVQFSTLALLVSSRSLSADAAIRTTYALVLAVTVLPPVPYWFAEGTAGQLADVTAWLRCLSPVPAVAEVLGHGGVGDRGMGSAGGTVWRYFTLAAATSLVCAVATVLHLRRSPLDRARAAGVMTQDRSGAARAARRVFFLIDPQRRRGSTSLLVNPVLVKEFRSRRFGRSHWMLRLVAISAILSLGLSVVAASGALGWGPEAIGAALVLLQTALLLLFVPSLAAGIISTEREGGTWQLLRMTPLSPGAILRGKLMSVAWPLLLLLCATLPGYLVMATITPHLTAQAERVVVCLALTAVFAVLVSAAASSVFRSTASATAAANLVLVGVCLAPLLVWLGRGAPFGHRLVEAVLAISPVAAALHATDTPGFEGYAILPLNWWVMGAASVVLLIVLAARTRQLYRPE